MALTDVFSRTYSDQRLPAWKRPMDVILASILLLAFSPLIIVTAFAIKVSGPGPVLFRQTRIGLYGRRFSLLKFRSMYVDAESRRAHLLSQSDRPGLCFKARHDPRITPVGRILRRYSIDEIPQLINVLMGDMSLVGPRPALPDEVDVYPPYARARLQVLPGVTGLWQVSGRAEVGFDEMVDMDLSYAADCSIVSDLGILARTVSVVLTGKGAY